MQSFFFISLALQACLCFFIPGNCLAGEEDNGSGGCVKCSADSYNPTPGGICLSCPSTSTTNGDIGSTAETDCGETSIVFFQSVSKWLEQTKLQPFTKLADFSRWSLIHMLETWCCKSELFHSVSVPSVFSLQSRLWGSRTNVHTLSTWWVQSYSWKWDLRRVSQWFNHQWVGHKNSGHRLW